MTTKPRATAPHARMDPHTARRGMFVLEDGRNVVFTFFLLVFLFALWGFCNGMIDVMDKHFQEELHLNLAQSAWVQFAHYLGYFLMAIPAGWLAIKLGYKGGIIAGLLMVAAGGFWFIPASHIAQFWAFLLGVCVIAAGLTFLETIANPYTTVLGPPQYAATRINLAQSINGIGLLLGPIAGGAFFYSKNAAGISTGSEQLWIPYAFIGVVVIILAIVFFFAPMPNIEMEDDYHIDDIHAGYAAVDLVASAFLDGGARAIPLRRRAGRNLQLFHQLHDVAGAAGAHFMAPARRSGLRILRRLVRDAPKRRAWLQ